MRNGDYVPSRMDAQQDAAHLLCNTKRQSNVENSVAIITMASPSVCRPKVLVTLTSEQSKLQHALASARLEGHGVCNLSASLQVAQLILKNRQNSNQRQRIVAFIGSPLGITSDQQLSSLAAVGKLLKKNGVALDIVSFGNPEENHSAIVNLLATAGGLDLMMAQKNIHEALLDPNCDCHLLAVSPGQSLHEALMTSPILLGSDGSAQVGEFGMDGDMDPELAMALKLSLEEEKSRLDKEKAAGKPVESSKSDGDDKSHEHADNQMAIDEDDEEAALARAIAMSMESAQVESNQQQKQQPNQ